MKYNWRLLFGIFMILTSTKSYSRTLNVYFSSGISAKKRQQILTQSKLGFDQILVFAKFREYIRYQKKNPAEYLIQPGALPEPPGYQCRLSFQIESQGKYNYSLITIDKNWTLANTKRGVLGVVDEVGRRNIDNFTKQILPKLEFKLIRSVAKLEDLMRLLALENANYILIAPHNLQQLKKQFPMKTYLISQSRPIAYPLLCSKGTGKIDLLKMESSIIKNLGFTSIASAMEVKHD
ncbi:hypothetical protein [Pseudobacteriovorax antillogorgiicola]|uniref:Solute-binding protein family 3/N-terminal domain-containing protein n=1 Tax=Pseudobacteriovorax antillogorgiicola TaxID=1513793 RepID=A0A1Y6BM58_9BACT|nr:hypothetical protein [Pseudobacteriovorax antillogorgiicola]TCS54492.1 hypothetical protein EDD56_1065 [Pseudobacteriovorax antillogorgiicola]SMF19089.1 hypothetical protein SAMN06296036_106239 [Pseudobacteriovorax antillogorgiicola]